MPVNKLILVPRDPQASLPDIQPLHHCLTDAGLIGDGIQHGDHSFYPTGDHFLQLISFLGCSPAIELDPPADPEQLGDALHNATFCYVTLALTEQITFRSDLATRPPRCPECRKPDNDWQTALHGWQVQDEAVDWTCPACGHRAAVTRLDFRKTAAFGQVFVEIHGIYPSEAVPCDPLMQGLAGLTGGPWHAIYIKE